MTDFIRHFLLAVQFFTRIPVTGRLADWVGFSPEMLRASAAHFPGVGWIVGIAAALVFYVAQTLLPWSDQVPLVAAVLCTAATVWLTGALHEDGLADMVDGLGGSQDRVRALEIMKDSRVGSFGVLALLLTVLAKVGLLALLGDLDTALGCAALFAGHVVSRTWPLLIIRGMEHVGDEAGSKSKPLADSLSGTALASGLVWCGGALLLASTLIDPLALLAALACSALAWAYMRGLLARRLQGFTGDCLGATQQLCELAFYLGLGMAVPA